MINLCRLVIGCGLGCWSRESPAAEVVPLPKAAPVDVYARVVGTAPDRFRVESYGGFNAGYRQHVREIVIVTDIKTGFQYLGITGCGATELRQEMSGKQTVTVEE